MLDDPEPGRQPLITRLRNARRLRILSQRDYGLFTLGNGISLTGSWMQRIALLWLVWDLTESGFWLGILATADMLPVLVISPLAGLAADRWDRLKQTRLSQIVLTVIAGLLGLLLMLDLLSLPVLLLLVTANGCMVALNQPARMALVQSLVRREDVGTAVALNSVNVNLARLTGPAIAGAMIVFLDVEWVFIANAALTLVFVVILGFVHASPMQKRDANGSMLSEIFGGLVFVFGDRGIRLLLGLLFLGGAGVRSVQDLFPAFAAQNFASTATGLAALTSGMAVGAVAAGLTFGADAALHKLARRVVVSWVVAAIALAGLALSASSLIDIGLVMVMGFFGATSVIGTQTFVQLRTPDAMRGRTLSVHGLISRASPALGALACGWAFDHFGLAVPVLIATGLVLSAALLTMRQVWALGELKDED
ncbi:MAG: MFS transporter [Devosia sp.]